jgi:hypothetical protein
MAGSSGGDQGTYAGHIQGMTALLTASPSGPRCGISTVKVDHGCVTHWKGKGQVRVPQPAHQAGSEGS